MFDKISDWVRHTLELEWVTHATECWQIQPWMPSGPDWPSQIHYMYFTPTYSTCLYFDSSLNDPFYLSHYFNERNTQTPIYSSQIPTDYIHIWEASAWHGGTTSVEDKMHVLKSMSVCDHPQYQHSCFDFNLYLISGFMFYTWWWGWWWACGKLFLQPAINLCFKF